MIIVAWSLRDDSPAYFSIRHYYELTDNRTIDFHSRRTAPKHKELIPEKLKNVFHADIFVPVSNLWPFSVVFKSKKDGNLRFCVEYLSLNRDLKADRWTFSLIEEAFDVLRGPKLFSAPDLLSGCWKMRMSDSCMKKGTNSTTS